MKTTIIDLFNKIANGEVVPMKIKYKDDDYVFNIDTKQYYEGDDLKKINTFYNNSLKNRLYNFEMLNDEVEILDEPKEDKIEKIDVAWQNVFDEQAQQDFAKMTLNKINEIIDKLNGGKE